MRLVQIHRAYGTAYLFAWAHRVSGIGLLLFLYAHIFTLSDLLEPAQFDSKMAWLAQVGSNYVGLVLALPVIFHALNGGRLMLYEIFGNRRDEVLVAWVAGLAILYWILLFFVMNSANISLASFTLNIALMVSLAMAGGLIMAISKSKMGLYWKMQRISGAFLVIMIPVHLVFMHADPAAGHDSGVILSRIRADMLIRAADILIVVSALYHGAYGLIAIAKDYLKSETGMRWASILITIFSILFGWLGIKTIAMV
jgi:succinate dehydrogenase hydrophobic anchor subunit